MEQLEHHFSKHLKSTWRIHSQCYYKNITYKAGFTPAFFILNNMPSKKTLVLGASTNPEQYSNMAIVRLRSHGHAVEAIGKTAFQIKDVYVGTEKIDFPDIHTITLYLNPTRQIEYVEYIFSLNPTRIIFNPGAENENLKKLAENQGIEAINACTLVLLSTGAY